ncbi:unnamed protein product [Anisakis simplex]|uniref:Btz domain-containing protein n=1 Tax=Anisakis simplex TaxID=6269 RepID=A0A0M3IYU0_ANISI|nr:unnamed protein product [Anisakis simplex]
MSELPPAGEGGSAALSEESKSRKPRPAVQLYRPGMMKGVDITKVGQSRTLPRTKPPKSQPITEITTNDPRKSEKLDEWSGSGRSNNRGGRAGRGRSRGGGKGDTIRSYNAADLDQRSEIASVCSNDDIQSEGGYKRRRRRRKSSGGSSSTSSTYRYESNSTITSSRCNINKEAVSNSPRQRLINNVKGFHSSSQSLFDRPPSSLGGRQYRNYNWNDEHSWRFNSKSPSKKQNRNEQFRGDGTVAADYNQKHFERNHRYSSYREQSRGSNNNKNTSRSNHDDRFVSAYEGSDMYASKRSGQQKRGGRGRGQQQSNGPFRSDRHAGSNSGSRNKSETRSGQRLDEEYRTDEEVFERPSEK